MDINLTVSTLCGQAPNILLIPVPPALNAEEAFIDTV